MPLVLDEEPKLNGVLEGELDATAAKEPAFLLPDNLNENDLVPAVLETLFDTLIETPFDDVDVEPGRTRL